MEIGAERIYNEKKYVRRSGMAVTKEQIERINALAKKQRSPEGLTEEEKAEQKMLRDLYIAGFRESLKQTLDNTIVQEPDGTQHALRQKEDPAGEPVLH